MAKEWLGELNGQQQTIGINYRCSSLVVPAGALARACCMVTKGTITRHNPKQFR